MNREICIGKKVTRIEVLKSILVISLIPLLIFIILEGMIYPTFTIPTIYKNSITIGIFLLCYCLLIPMIGGTQRIEFINNEFIYYHIQGYKEQLMNVWNILLKNKETIDFKLKSNHIDSVHLSYKLTMGGYGLYGYTIVFTFITKDSNTIKLTPYDIAGGGNYNQSYLQLLDIWKQQGIPVYDQNNLQDILPLSDSKILTYLKKLEGTKHD